MTDNRARADRYAQAVLQAMLERWQGALNTVTEAIGRDLDLANMLNDASTSAAAKSQALTGLLPADTPVEVSNLLNLLVQENDLKLLPEIGSALAQAASGQQSPLKAEIVSAAELDADEREKLRQSLSRKYGAGLDFSFHVDPALLGGLRVRVGDHLIDNSVASRLAKLRESIATAVR